MNSITRRTAAVLGAICFISPQARPQLGGQQVPETWSIADDGQYEVATDIQGGKTYRIHNDGPDGLILVVARDGDNNVILDRNVKKGQGKDVGVPDGGDVYVLDGDGPDDPDPGNSVGATGTYQTV